MVMTDILDRLKATTKINGAYPKDIEDAIIEIERLREYVEDFEYDLERCKRELSECS